MSTTPVAPLRSPGGFKADSYSLASGKSAPITNGLVSGVVCDRHRLLESVLSSLSLRCCRKEILDRTPTTLVQLFSTQ